METLENALASHRAIIALNVSWSVYARNATSTLEKAASTLKSLGIRLVTVDEDARDVRTWLNDHAPALLGGEHSRGAGSILWVENGHLVDIEVCGGDFTLLELLNRTRDLWDNSCSA